MPIDKVLPQDMFEDGELLTPFYVVPSETSQALFAAGKGGSDAVAIACYLADKPEDWIIRRKDIMNNLSIGRPRYDRAVKIMKDIGLWSVETVREPETNRFVERIVTFSIGPDYSQWSETCSAAPDHDTESDNVDENGVKPSDTAQRSESCSVDTDDSLRSGFPTVRFPTAGKANHLHKNILLTQKQINTHAPDGAGEPEKTFENFVENNDSRTTDPSEKKKWEDLTPVRDLLRANKMEPKLATRKALLAINKAGVDNLTDAEKLDIIQAGAAR